MCSKQSKIDNKPTVLFLEAFLGGVDTGSAYVQYVPVIQACPVSPVSPVMHILHSAT